MAGFSASDMAFTGFRVVRERPWAVAIWAALQFVVSLGYSLFVAYSAGPAFTKLSQLKLDPASEDQSALLLLIQQVAPASLVVVIGALVLNSVLYAAMNRAVLKPEDSRFGYLRLAADELRQLGLFAVFAGLAIIAYAVIVIVAAVLIVIVGVGGGMALGLAIVLPAVICVFIFLAVRLSLASPMTFDTHRIDPLAAWRMTKGRFWSLFGAYFLAFALRTVVVVLTFAIAVAVVAVVGGGMGAMTAVVQSDLSSVAAVLTPPRLAYMVVSSIGQALVWPVTMTPPAAIYRAITGAPAAAGRTFD